MPEYYAGSTATGTPFTAAPIDAGTYTVVAEFPGSTDYTTGASQPVTFAISQATPTVSVSASGGAYNGSGYGATAAVAGLGGTPGSELEGIATDARVLRREHRDRHAALPPPRSTRARTPSLPTSPAAPTTRPTRRSRLPLASARPRRR